MNIINKVFIASIFLSVMLILTLVMPNVVHAQYYTGLCIPNSYERCNGNGLYWYDSCGNIGNLVQYCQNGCYNNACQNYNNYNNCTYHSYETCVGNNLYWYDSCGNQQDLAQYCSNGCNVNSCQTNYNNYNNYSNCTYHAYKLCSGNNVYWYDSCGTQQDLYSSCGGGQTCQYGQCSSYVQPAQPVQPTTNYVAHYRTACYGSSLYWYDSRGINSGLYKKCKDTNSCTLNSCSSNKCVSNLKCDGTTCSINSVDFNKYCPTKQTPPAPATTPATTTPAPVTIPNQNQNQNSTPQADSQKQALAISFFVKQNSDSNQWQKSVKINSNGQVYFMISATNSSTAQIDSVNISANIPTEISSLGNLQINGVPFSGDIVSGINVGPISSQNTKLITFEGKTQSISTTATKPATITSNASGATLSDSVSLNLTAGSTNSNQATADISKAQASTGLGGFLKRWYLWILAGIILIFLFFMVYKRLSRNI